MAALSFFQDGVSGINNQLIIAVPLLVQDGVSSIFLQLLIFCCVRTNMAALFFTCIEKMDACIFSVCFKDIKTLS
jgi:hypothetical protein